MDTTKTPNNTLIFVSVAIVGAVGIAGGIVLTVFDKDATAFYGFFTTTLVSIIGFGGLAKQQGKTNASQAEIATTVQEVKANVNGRLSQLIEIATQNATTRNERKTVQRIGVESGVIPTIDEPHNG